MKYIDAEKLIAEIERWRDKAKEKYNESTYSMGRCDALAEFRNYMVSLQQEPPEDTDTLRAKLVNFLIRNHIQEDEAKYLADRISDTYGAQRYLDGLWDAANAYEQQEQPEVDFEKAARHVYESWMGGTMDEFRRDMDELSKVLNARKEE